MTAPFGRDGEIEAFVVDRYLESLLAREPLDPSAVPAELGATARRLADGLPRFHPSFRFEEALAARLTAVAGRIGSGEVVAMPLPGDADAAEEPGRSMRRPVVIGGVLTSAALSVAGAAYVAWRFGRPADPMTRAVRAVARARLV